jgi:hypothetical protein
MNIFDQAIGKPVMEWPGLFSLHLKKDGFFQVELGHITAPREVTLRWKLQAEEYNLMTALTTLCWLSPMPLPAPPKPVHNLLLGGSNYAEIHRAAEDLHCRAEWFKKMAERLRQAIGGELEVLGDSEKPDYERKKARNRIELRIGHVLDALYLKDRRKAHSGSTIIQTKFYEAPLAWWVLQTAKSLVLEQLALPTKQAVKDRLTQLHNRRVKNVSSPQWAAAFKDAGLSTLPKASAKKSSSRKQGRNR